LPALSARHWMISSARRSIDCGIVRPRAFAVLTLMTSSNLVGCSTGRSAGLAPLRVLSIRGRAAKEIGKVRPIGQEATNLDELPRSRHSRQPILERQIHYLPRVLLEREIDDETAHARILQDREGIVQLAGVAHQHCTDL